MRHQTTLKALGLLALSVVGFQSRSYAAPVLYDINFTLLSGPPAPTSGSFDYDSTAAIGSQFSSFIVDWDGYAFNFTAAANAATVTNSGCTAATSATIFNFLTGTGSCPGTPNSFTWKADTNNAGSNANPTFNFFDDGNPTSTYIILGASAGTVPAPTSLSDISGNYIATPATTVPEPSSIALVSVSYTHLTLPTIYSV